MNKVDQQYIEMIAQQYGFEVNYDTTVHKLIVQGWAMYSTENFYWTSDKTIEVFFEELKRFFMEEGAEQYK